jgi:hypothetical protein
MTSIPDCVSTADLLKMLNADLSNDEDRQDKQADDLSEATPAELVKHVTDAVDEAIKSIKSPFGFKLVADYALFQLQKWNEYGYKQMIEDNHSDVAMLWAADAGTLKAMQDTLREINCGQLDFMCSEDNE